MEALESNKSTLERISELVIENEQEIAGVESLLKGGDFESARNEIDRLIEKILDVDSLEWTGGLSAGRQFPGANEMHHALNVKIREEIKKEKENGNRIYIRFEKTLNGLDPIQFDTEDGASTAYAYVRQLKEIEKLDSKLSYEKNLYSQWSGVRSNDPSRARLFSNLSRLNKLEVYRDLSEAPEERRAL